MEIDLSDALCIYLGAGPQGGYRPIGSGEERLRVAYPSHFAEARAAIAKYLVELDYPVKNWTSDNLAAEQRVYEESLRVAYPELSARAINALACRWSYSWR